MTTDSQTIFVDGLRVTPQHLMHLQSALQQAVMDVRHTIGTGAVAYGLRLTLDEGTVSLHPGVAFSEAGLRLHVAEVMELALPPDVDLVKVVLVAENSDDPLSRLDDLSTIVYCDTNVVLIGGDADPPTDGLVIGTVDTTVEGLAVEQPPERFVSPSRHAHSGDHYVDEAGVWRYDGPTAADWTQVNLTGFGTTNNRGTNVLASYGGQLYAGTENWNTGCEVWRWDGPTAADWTQVNTGGFGDAGVAYADSILVSGGLLWVGTGGSGGERSAGSQLVPGMMWASRCRSEPGGCSSSAPRRPTGTRSTPAPRSPP